MNFYKRREYLKMDLHELLIKRFSARSFKPEPVPSSLIIEVLEAGRLAPSAVNYQPWIFIVVEDKDLLSSLWGAYPREWFKTAPQVIVICGNHDESWKRGIDQKDHCDIDSSIAIDHMTLMATYRGLGTCWVCNFNPILVSKALSLPPHLEPIALLPIGFPADGTVTPEKKRKPLSEIAFLNNLGNPYKII